MDDQNMVRTATTAINFTWNLPLLDFHFFCFISISADDWDLQRIYDVSTSIVTGSKSGQGGMYGDVASPIKQRDLWLSIIG